MPRDDTAYLLDMLACISHHPTVEARDTTARTSLRLLAVLNVLSSTPARAKRLAPRPDGPLTHFASPRGEKCRLVAARDAAAFAEGVSYAEFERDRRTQLSVLKSLEIVGEAAAHISEDTRKKHPAIPWPEIVGMRNRLVHVYFDIDLPLVWDTVRNDLPVLIARLEPLVPPEAG